MAAEIAGNAIREALEPFLPHADVFGWRPDDFVVYGSGGMNITAGDLRRARTAYDAIGSGVKARDEAETFVRNYLLERDDACGFLHHDDSDAGEERKESAREIVAALSTHTAAEAGPVGEAVEIMAAALWKEEAREGTPKSVYEGRTLEAFREQSPETIYRWTRFARAAHAARPVEEPGEVERLRAEGFALAANQCRYGYGDEHGHHRCAEIDRLTREIFFAKSALAEARGLIRDAIGLVAALTGDAQEGGK